MNRKFHVTVQTYHLYFDVPSACTVDSAVQQWKKSHAAVNDLSKKHVTEVEALVRQVDYPLYLQFLV